MHSDVASVMSRAVSRPLLEKTFHMKIQSRKVFTHRDSYQTILAKTEDLLMKVRSFSSYCFRKGGPSGVERGREGKMSASVDRQNELLATTRRSYRDVFLSV